jgi:hypothetical protein
MIQCGAVKLNVLNSCRLMMPLIPRKVNVSRSLSQFIHGAVRKGNCKISAGVMACSFQVLVYLYTSWIQVTGMSYVQVVRSWQRTIWPSWNLNVGHTDTGRSWFEFCYGTSTFLKGRGKHVHFFLLVPNNSCALCLGAETGLRARRYWLIFINAHSTKAQGSGTVWEKVSELKQRDVE